MHHLNKLSLAILSILFISGCDQDIEIPVSAPASSIEIERLHGDSPQDWVFSLGYALAHGFSDIHIEGNRYHRVDRGVVYIENSEDSPLPRYLITESRLDSFWERLQSMSFSERTNIKVTDRKTGKMILNWNAPVSGWPGDQTGKKLAELLRVQKPNFLKININEKASTNEFHTQQLTDLPPNKVRELLTSAPCLGKLKSVEEKRIDHKPIIKGDSWQIRTPQNFREALCNDHGIFINRAWHPEDLDLIWLQYDGKLKLISFIKGPKTKMGGEYYPSKLISIQLNGNAIIAHRAFIIQDRSSGNWKIDKEIKYTLPLKLSEL